MKVITAIKWGYRTESGSYTSAIIWGYNRKKGVIRAII